MSHLINMFKGDEVIAVHPLNIDEHKNLGWQVSTMMRIQGTPEELGTDSGDQFSDEQLRDAIKTATGKAPHWKSKRETLIEEFHALNAA